MITRTIFFFALVFVISQQVFAQDYSLDTTFNPQFNFYSPQVGYCPAVFNISEHSSGSVFISGDIHDVSTGLGSVVQFYANGELDLSFNVQIPPGYYWKYFEANADTLELLIPPLRKFNMNGEFLNVDWVINNNEDFLFFDTQDIHMFDDGSMLAVGDFNLQDMTIRYDLLKVKPDGHVDSSFIIDAFEGSNSILWDIHPYDESRFLVYGKYESWLGTPAKRMSRINISDGSIDTTFHNIFEWGHVEIHDILADGRILVAGHFQLEGDTTILTIARLKPDGSLDPSFNNFNSIEASYYHSIKNVCPTPDGGYLVGGFFFNYQEHFRGCIAKIDSNGFLDTTVLNGLGFDTLSIFENYSLGVMSIEPAQNNKYYIGGNFKSFNGDSVSPVIRIHGNTLGIAEQVFKQELLVYPNPASGRITIETDHLFTELRIYSQMGELIEIVTNTDLRTTIDVSIYPIGTYFIQATNDDEKFNSRFIIVR